MEKIILCIVLSTLSLSSFAGHGHQNNRLEHMTEKLQLTEAQQTQLKVILDKNAAQRKAMREAMRSMREAANNDVREILNPEQQQKFDKMREQRKAKHNNKKKMNQKNNDQ